MFRFEIRQVTFTYVCPLRDSSHSDWSIGGPWPWVRQPSDVRYSFNFCKSHERTRTAAVFVGFVGFHRGAFARDPGLCPPVPRPPSAPRPVLLAD